MTIVNLGADTASVGYNMICSDFDIVELNPGTGFDPEPTWLHLTQQQSNPGYSRQSLMSEKFGIELKLYCTLFANMQKTTDNMINIGAPFSGEQLLFDLSNASLETVPTISIIDPRTNLYRILQTFFISSYFTQLQNNGEPAFSAQIYARQPDQSALHMRGYEIEVSPYIGTTNASTTDLQKQCATTLHYLCTATETLPPLVPFTWNWVDIPELSDHKY
jgi:hypothetical protein